MNKEQVKAMQAFIKMTTMAQSGLGFAGIFGGMVEPSEKYPYDRLGEGYELRPIEMKDKKGNPIVNRSEYSHLYHNDLKISDQVFRRGGIGGDFKEGYCSLIAYLPDNTREEGFSSGFHVIINATGEIVLSAKSSYGDHPYHQGGNIAKMKDTYYNLLTGEEILTASSPNVINSKNYIYIEHRYDWYNKDLPVGVYMICKKTGEYQFIDHVK